MKELTNILTYGTTALMKHLKSLFGHGIMFDGLAALCLIGIGLFVAYWFLVLVPFILVLLAVVVIVAVVAALIGGGIALVRKAAG